MQAERVTADVARWRPSRHCVASGLTGSDCTRLTSGSGNILARRARLEDPSIGVPFAGLEQVALTSRRASWQFVLRTWRSIGQLLLPKEQDALAPDIVRYVDEVLREGGFRGRVCWLDLPDEQERPVARNGFRLRPVLPSAPIAAEKKRVDVRARPAETPTLKAVAKAIIFTARMS